MKRKTKGTLTLLILLLISSAFMAGTGVAAKDELENYEDQPAVAVPFLLLRDDAVLEWMSSAGPETEVGETAAPETRVPETTAPEATVPVTTLPAPTVPETAPPTKPAIPETVPRETMPPVAVYGEDESYFDDALFIGDSRMVGVSQYSRLGGADYFACEGMTVFDLFSSYASDENFDRTSLENLLSQRQYGKIFIMLGLNEAGYPMESLKKAYGSDLDQIQQLQPDAEVRVILLFGLSKWKADKVSYMTPEYLSKVNGMIQDICAEREIVTLDPRPVMEDEHGYLPDDYSGDGIHPYGKIYPILAQWLCREAG